MSPLPFTCLSRAYVLAKAIAWLIAACTVVAQYKSANGKWQSPGNKGPGVGECFYMNGNGGLQISIGKAI